MLVGEVHDRVHFALHLLPIRKNRIAAVGDLGGGDRISRCISRKKPVRNLTMKVHDLQQL